MVGLETRFSFIRCMLEQELTRHPQMFAPVRVVATIVFLGSIGLVFVGAFVLGNDVSQHI